jgi:hypothetical protein
MLMLYFTVAGLILTLWFNSAILGLAVAGLILVWIAVIAWRTRNEPHDPSLY